MKKLILLAAFAIGGTSVSNAQEIIKEKEVKKVKEGKKQHEIKTPEERAQKSVDHLNNAVGLSDDQKTKIYDLALNRAKKVDAVKEKYKGQPDGREKSKGVITTIKKEYRKSVKGILTPEQLTKLKAKAAEAGKGQGQTQEKGAKGVKGDKGEKGEKGSKEEDDVKTIGDED